MLRVGHARGIGGIKPVDVRQQDEPVRLHHAGDARGEAVVVAIADLGRRHRVVLVDDRNAAQLQQRLQRGAGIEIAVALFGVTERQQDLRRDDAFAGQDIGIGLGETHLPRRRRGLAFFELQRTCLQFQRTPPERDGAGGHEQDVLARALQLCHIGA